MGSICITVNNKQHNLPKLTPRECIAITQLSFEQRRQKALQDLQDAGSDAKLKQTTLDELRSMEGTIEPLVSYARQIEGRMDIIRRSIAKMPDDKPADPDTWDMELPELHKLALQLCGFTLRDIDDNDGFVDDRPTNSGAIG